MSKLVIIISLSLLVFFSCNFSTNSKNTIRIKRPEALIVLLETINSDPSNIKYAQHKVLGRLLYRLMEYKFDSSCNSTAIHSDLEKSALVVLDNGIKKPRDYYEILSYMLQIENANICCELYKDEKTGLYKTRDIAMNPNYIIDNEIKLREWLISDEKNQIRLNQILSNKNINNREDWYETESI
ncbi:hypothetical protein A8C32_15130 [Flavivirga aquatica]|uniref:Lipoprotein n=1 Tax=Flavivirga aquatica TaxID=1849968 RepID=A0A1E5T900_9FLAO|nr:hypothetical protein [Flavivirga aquatica]OEK07818.1 hypothetical protein A8C32_15130 [Flavivirga aquatica]